MNIAIVGGGAVGLLFAFYFAENEHHVTVYVRRREQAQALARTGLTLLHRGHRRSAAVAAKVLSHTGRIHADLAVIAVKQYHLATLADVLKITIDKNTRLLFVQNGMGHVSLLDTWPHAHIDIGVVEHGVLKKSDTTIDHTGVGLVKMAPYRGCGTVREAVGAGFPSFPFSYRDDWYPLLAEKLLVNAVINPLTAIYGVKNGVLAEDPKHIHEMEQLFHEAISVLELDNESQQWERLLHVCRNTSDNRSSMLRDIENSRPTEIDAISGFLLQQGKRKGKALPFTASVYAKVKQLESHT